MEAIRQCVVELFLRILLLHAVLPLLSAKDVFVLHCIPLVHNCIRPHPHPCRELPQLLVAHARDPGSTAFG
eukprot:10199521-Heterocapsa_arctica.AAC.1